MGAFVNDTIWVGSSQSATQHILNVANEFFNINDILINNDKTVAILINCKIADSSLLISGSPIFIAKRGESHCYLGIYLSTKDLSKPSLVKAHSDVQFFANLVLKKTVSDKHACEKWNTLIHKGLKSKSGLPCNFSSDAIHYPFLYGLKTFEQIQAKNKFSAGIHFILCSTCAISANLLCSNVGHFSVYMNGSLSGLGSIDMKAGAAVFFKDIGMGLGVGVFGLMFSTLTEL
ncbi:hypothetical protein G9A89_012024 [Geosiphon pyriformis]|nr:hypothetical protein G9A89_012024 [Geosiphon pyriformis]